MSDIRGFLGAKQRQATKKVSKRAIRDSDDDDDDYVDDTVKNASKEKEPEIIDSAAFFKDSKIKKGIVKKVSKKAEYSANADDYAGDLDDEALAKLIEETEKAESAAISPAKTASQKRSAAETDNTPMASPPAKRPKTKAASTKTSKEVGPDSSSVVASIIQGIPTIDLPEAIPSEAFKYNPGNQPAVLAPGSKEIPTGADDCLTGLTFVFTGVLTSLERTEAQDLVKRYGARVTSAPSAKTSFVVIGDQAGPSKIEKIRKLGVKTIDEDGLLQLISSMPAFGGDSAGAKKVLEKREADERKAQDEALAMAKQEAKNMADLKAKQLKGASTGQIIKTYAADDMLWTSKYAPNAMKDVIGNKANVEKLAKFLNDWPKNLKSGFKKPGPDGMGLYRAVLVSGSPGIGKTTSAHLVAKLAGYDILEFNASDTRSKRLLEDGLKGVVNNNSLAGYFAIDGQAADHEKKRLVLIMDEVDGMSAGDRGGVGALNAVIKKSSIPMICICNDRSSQKLKPLEKTTFDIRFSKPTKDQIRSRIMSIAYKEKLKLENIAIDQLVEGTGSDIRQILTLLSTYRLTATTMDQNQGRNGAKAAQKHVILKPWDIVSKLLNGASYNALSKTTLNEKIELYFNDHELSYLMVQENYLGTNPDQASKLGGAKQAHKKLQLASRAAGAISDGDLVDSMIHGPQQHWSLMPTHAVFSCVRPASFIAGPAGRTNFTSVLGNMSRMSKATRLLRELRAHLLLKTSGDRQELRRDYIPALFDRIPKILSVRGAEAIPEIIEVMDNYFLSRDDYDSLLDLGIGMNTRESVEGTIPSTVKSSFTRQYNQASHPVAFVVASAGAPAKKLPKGELPDFEDAVEGSDDEAEVKEEVKNEDELDMKTDKLVSAPKKKGKAAAKTGAASKAKKPAAKAAKAVKAR